MAKLSSSVEVSCPFINRNDARCAPRFSLSRLNQAFDVCLNGHWRCPVYQQLVREQRREQWNPSIHITPVTPLTVEGRSPRDLHRRIAV